MSLQIAIISSPEYCTYIRDLESDLDLPCTLSYVVNTRSSELPALFENIKEQYDAFCTTGAASREIILRSCPDCTKPIQAITESASEFYQVLLRLLYTDRSCDFSRILFDDSLWIRDQKLITALDYVKGLQEYSELRRQESIKKISLPSLLRAEEIITQRALQLQEEGKLEMVVCRHSQACAALKEAGIPCTLAYPSPGNISDSLRHLCDTLNLIRMEESLPAVILLSSGELRATGPEDITSAGVSLQKCLLDFDQENTAGMLIKKAAGGFELYTTRCVVQRLTQRFRRCTLRACIMSRLGMEVEIGYGIGNNIISARDNATLALRRSQKDSQSCLVDEKGTLRVLLPAEGSPQAEDPHLQKTAQDTGLSVATLQRIRSAIALTGSNEITTQELAKALQVTVANANRFMNQLQSAGYADVVAEKKGLTRGRPARVYQIHF